MSDSSTSRAEIVRYGPMTREEAIADVGKRWRKISSVLHGLNEDGPPDIEESPFWVWHATMISQWVTESQFRGFFESEREANENVVQDLEEVLGEERTEASGNNESHVLQQRNNRAILQLKWTGLARECLRPARLCLLGFASFYLPRWEVRHMFEIMQTKKILFMAEQARYGDVAARKELVRFLIMDGDCKPRYRFPCCTAKFTAEIIAKYSVVSEKMYPVNKQCFDDTHTSRVNYWCPIVHQDAYMEQWLNGRRSSHIAPKTLNMRGWVLLAVAEPGDRLWWPSNGLVIDSYAGVSIQNLDFVTVPSGGPESEDLEIHVLNERNLRPQKYFDKAGEPCSRTISFQGRKLVFKNAERPDRKTLYFQWLLAVLKWILDPEEEGLDSELAWEELSRHDEIWGTSSEYVRQELLEALAEKSGIDIPITNAIPAGRISDADMAEILVDEMYDGERCIYRKIPENDYWRCWERETACRGSEIYAERIMEAIDCLDDETLNLADMICKGKILDHHDLYDRCFERDPSEYQKVFQAIYEEEYDGEMDYFLYS